jgi:hypothetical protein
MITVYHGTDSAEKIMAEGFRDGPDGGVYVSVLALGRFYERAQTIQIEIPTELFVEHQASTILSPPGSPADAVIPAVKLNAYRASFRILSDEELQAVIDAQR